jgi:hypothetical protein
MSTYTFNKHVIKHRFCPKCGIHPFREGVDPNGQEMAAVNVRCLEGIELESLRVQHFKGAPFRDVPPNESLKATPSSAASTPALYRHELCPVAS